MEIQKMMKSTLNTMTVQTIEDSAKTARRQWLFKWPAQLIVTVDQVIWTSDVTNAIGSLQLNPQALQTYYQKMDNLLMEIVELVRGDVSKIDRITLGVLVVIQVHA